MPWNQKALTTVIRQVAYKDWTFRILPKGDGFLLQTRFVASGELQSCRKWYISSHSTQSEVVQTAFKAVLSAEEHEVRELFKYKGQSIFNPHFNVDQRAAAMKRGHLPLDSRPK